MWSISCHRTRKLTLENFTLPKKLWKRYLSVLMSLAVSTENGCKEANFTLKMTRIEHTEVSEFALSPSFIRWQHIIIQSMIRWAVRHPMRRFCCAQTVDTHILWDGKKRNSQSINDRPLAAVGLTVAVIIIINRKKEPTFGAYIHNFLFHFFAARIKKSTFSRYIFSLEREREKKKWLNFGNVICCGSLASKYLQCRAAITAHSHYKMLKLKWQKRDRDWAIETVWMREKCKHSRSILVRWIWYTFSDAFLNWTVCTVQCTTLSNLRRQSDCTLFLSVCCVLYINITKREIFMWAHHENYCCCCFALLK